MCCKCCARYKYNPIYKFRYISDTKIQSRVLLRILISRIFVFLLLIAYWTRRSWILKMTSSPIGKLCRRGGNQHVLSQKIANNYEKSVLRANFWPIPCFVFHFIFIEYGISGLFRNGYDITNVLVNCEIHRILYFLSVSQKHVISMTCNKQDYLLYIAYWLPIDCSWCTYVQP